MHFEIIYLISVICVVSSLPPHLIRNRPIPAQGLGVIYRNTGNFYHPPNAQLMNLHLVQGLKPPLPQSYNYYVPTARPYNTYKNINNIYREGLMHTNALTYVHMAPPVITDEPNYYAMKFNKLPKKYSPFVKQIYYRPKDAEKEYELNASVESHPIRENPYIHSNEESSSPETEESSSEEHNLSGSFPKNHKTQASSEEEQDSDEVPQYQVQSHDDPTSYKSAIPKIVQGIRNDRLEYQMHGYDGPKSYKFGYDTGKGKDRQFRYEERDKDGHVKGQFGYLDKKGKTILVKYTSSPEKGFQVENIH